MDVSDAPFSRRVTRSMTTSKLVSEVDVSHDALEARTKYEAAHTPLPGRPGKRITRSRSPYHEHPEANKIRKQSRAKVPRARTPPAGDRFGLIQESIAHSLYALVVQAILWNQTGGKQARPVFEHLMAEYPDPTALARAKFDDLAEMLYPIGLYNSRAKRLIDMATTWLAKPPLPGHGYAKARDRKYSCVPLPVLDELSQVENGKATKPQICETSQQNPNVTSTCFWEIAHLPGVGPYALDSFRIFHRDEMRGLAQDWLGTGARCGFEPEWKRVVPLDKELRAYLKWLWARERWDWDWETGKRRKLNY